jgi:two-component system, response regulator
MTTIQPFPTQSRFRNANEIGAPFAMKNLMLIEDNEDDEMLTVRAIRKSEVPCSVEVIRHGAEAIARLIAPDGPIPALVVLDFHLPGYNGLEILRALRNQPRTRYVPVVILSGLGSDIEVSDCLEGGANSCVRKPMDAKVYVEHVSLIVRYWLTVDNAPTDRTLSPPLPLGTK